MQSKLLEKLGLTETYKEILMLNAPEAIFESLQDKLNNTFLFSKKNKGIIFSIPFMRWRLTDSEEKKSVHRNIKSSHYCIMTIVDKGRSKDCLKAAKAAGAKGGTIIHGRGAGVPVDYYFPLVIEPQKDIVLIITPKEKVVQIRKRIFDELELNKEGKGIIFVLPVIKINGLLENRIKENGRIRA